MAVQWKPRRISAGSEDLSSDFPDYEVVEHKILQYTNIDGGTFGNNKFYSCELQSSKNGKWRVYTNYHKVPDGEYVGAFEIRGPGTEQEMRALFESIIKEKTTRKTEAYKDVKFIKAKVGSPKARLIVRKIDEKEIPKEKKAAKAASVKPSITLDPKVGQLVESIFRDSQQTLTNFIDVKITADGFETPLGVLSYAQISDGQGALKELGAAIKKKDASAIRRLSSQYYTTIPHRLGFDITSAVLDNDNDLQRELDILQLMRDSVEVGSAAFTDTASAKYLELGADLAWINPAADEFKRIDRFIIDTASDRHSHLKGFKVRDVYKVILPHDRPRFDTCTIGNQVELFHGSRNCNIVGILKRGLLIAPPEAPVSGYMFDKGVYFADKSTKSLQYSVKAFGNYNQTGDVCYLFINQVKLGKQMIKETSCYDAAKLCKQGGYDSTWGKAGSALIHNEFITYKLEQSTITHVVAIEKPKGHWGY